MATELLANSPTPGANVPITTLSGNGGSISAIATSMKVAGAAPSALRGGTGTQFRILIDSELLLINASTSGTTTWTILARGVEGTTQANHTDGAAVYHVWTASALTGFISANSTANPVAPAPTGNASTDVSNLNSALATGGIVLAHPGTYLLNSMVTIPAGAGLVGVGSQGSGPPNTVFQCTTAGSGLKVSGTGPRLGDFTVEGNGVGNTPFLVGDTPATEGNQRLFSHVLVQNAVLDNWTVLYNQNNTFIACEGASPGRDNLVFGGGTGGHMFINMELWAAGRYGIYSNANIVPASSFGLYQVPSRILFAGGRNENSSGGAFQCDNGYGFTFDNFDLFSAPNNFSASIVNIQTLNTSYIHSLAHVFRDVGFGTSLGVTPTWMMYIDGNSEATLDGRCYDYTGKGVNVNAGGSLRVMVPTLHSGQAPVFLP